MYNDGVRRSNTLYMGASPSVGEDGTKRSVDEQKERREEEKEKEERRRRWKTVPIQPVLSNGARTR